MSSFSERINGPDSARDRPGTTRRRSCGLVWARMRAAEDRGLRCLPVQGIELLITRGPQRDPADIARGSAFPGVILGISRGLCRLSPKGSGAAFGSQAFGNAGVYGASAPGVADPQEGLPLTC
jgi:hypothetical protein